MIRGTQDLAGAAALGLSVVLASADDVPSAQAAGLGRERIVLDAGLTAEATAAGPSELLRHVDRWWRSGARCSSTCHRSCRLWRRGRRAWHEVAACWRTPDVRAARRTADVLAAILGARSEVRR